MAPLRPAAKTFLGAMALAAVASVVVALAWSGYPAADRLSLEIVLTGGVVLAGLAPLPFVARTKLYLDSAVLLVAVLLLDPLSALLVAAAGTLLGQAVRRQPWDQAVFNGAQATLQVATGAALLAAAGWRADRFALDQPPLLLLVLVAAAAMWLVNTLTTATIVGLQEGVPVRAFWSDTFGQFDRAEAAAELAQVAIGALAAALAHTQGWLAALLLLPAGALYQAMAHHLKRRRAAEARLLHQAYHDPLTDLPNRALFRDRLAQALARAGRRGEPLAILFLDLDRFKLVNDSLGHAAGDRLLIAVGERLCGRVRPGDTVARLGGDEFTILLDGLADPAEAEALVAEVAAALEAPFALDGREVAVTASIGVALAGAEHAVPEDLLRDADVALYRAKQRGKACCVVFEGSMRTGLRERVALEADLRRALERRALTLAYQPIVELATGRVVAMEALARWEHPERGPIPPSDFIPVAEEGGLIGALGRWAVEEACRQGQAWSKWIAGPPALSVNLSPRHFQEPGLVEEVARLLQATGFAPGRLQLEITESAVMGDIDAAVATLRQLKGLGTRIALDDFGTGYSSLSYLRRLPIDVLKIDQSFIAGLEQDAGDAAIVEAVLAVARTMGRTVVAEGVETAGQVARLRELGCGLGQGFYFGVPQPAAEIEPLLTKVTFATGARERSAG